MNKNRERIVCFDLIRLFSCLCVTIVHFNASISAYNGTFVYPNSLIPNFYLDGHVYLGGIGVSLFFMLSGATQMLTYKEGDLPGFYRKRFMSLFPMFWVAYAVATITDFLVYKGMTVGTPLLALYSAAGVDGYMSSLGFIGFGYYKLGEWFLGCILLLYVAFPLLHLGVKKAPVVTVGVAMALYLFFEIHPVIGHYRISGSEFFLRIPEMLFGMFFVKYRLWENRKAIWLVVFSAYTLVCAWFFRDHLSALTVTIALCLMLFSLFVLLARSVRGEWLKSRLGVLSVMTYPIFLTHHWLIDRMVRGFDLANLPRTYVYMMFFAYLLLTLVASWLLQRAGRWVSGWAFFRHRATSAVLWTLVFIGVVALPARAVVAYAISPPPVETEASAILPASAYSAKIVTHDTPIEIARGERYTVNVTVRNDGSTPWSEDGKIRLCVWCNGVDWARIFLPAGVEVLPGEKYTFTFDSLTVPEAGTGDSVIYEYQMVQETIQYFGEKARIDVHIVDA